MDCHAGRHSRVVFDPVTFTPSSSERSLKQVERHLLAAQSCVHVLTESLSKNAE